MRKEGKLISHELIYRYIRADETGNLASHCRHNMKYNRHGRPDRTIKVKNIPNRVSIHDRPAEANGKRFGDREMDIIVGKNGRGAIENANKLIRQYIPKGTDFAQVTPAFIKKVQAKINARPRAKFNFSSPQREFFKNFI